MKNIRFICFVLLAMVAVWAGRSNAEVITLQDGRVVEGAVVENRDDYITVMAEGREKVIRKNKIDKIEAKAGSGNIKMPITEVKAQNTKKVRLYMTTWCPYCRLMEQFLIEEVEAALRTLPPRDAKVLRLYFGLDGGQEHTLEEIGRLLGITRERVRQLRDRALKKLREGEVGRALASFAA